MTVWERFRDWRRSRPFWGGVLTILAGLELFASWFIVLHDGGTITIGEKGFPSYLAIFLLIIVGPLAWFTPAQRHFYGLLATFTAIASLILVNFGGFFVGMLLGVAGGGLIFAWNPASGAGVEPDHPADDDDDFTETSTDELLDGPMTDHTPPAVNPLREGAPGQPYAQDSSMQAQAIGRRTSRHAAAAVLAVALTASLMMVSAQGRAGAEPCDEPTTPPDPVPSPITTQGPLGELIDDIGDFFDDLFGWNSNQAPSPSPSASESSAPQDPAEVPDPCVTPSGTPTEPGETPDPSATPSLPSPSESASASPDPSASPVDPSASPSAAPVKLLPAEDGPYVAHCAGRMTGSRVTMYNLVYEGITELPRKGMAPIQVLKFTMSQSDTNDFLLHTFGDASTGGMDTDLASSKLTVKGGTVDFYTSRFQGNLFGLIPVDYHPGSEPPPIPLPLVFFTDPVVQLVLVDSPVLLAPDLNISLAEGEGCPW